ncbi:hypothetical protein J4E90_007512 [Alternaria incomplexa]|uniref:uncharacterized protein n=1 Tax=Alternaria incomplexa TaxID=1187928 RepID=UPI002220FC90|nr:uncharacterized protein J4E90_007512 [Alternaria incomplexa]KAI4910082.1 hypothetical protein J4E90_007512 [Alternaria incomplexa]
MRVNKILVALSAILPVALSASIPSPEGPCQPDTRMCRENGLLQCNYQGEWNLVRACGNTAVCTIDVDDPDDRGSCLETSCDNIGEERCLGNEWRLECNNEHQWKVVEACPVPGVCNALMNKTSCATKNLPPTYPGPPTPPQPEPCQTVEEVRCSKWSSGLHYIESCNYDQFWIARTTCGPQDFCMYWVPGKKVVSGKVKCISMAGIPPTVPPPKSLDSRSWISQGTPDAHKYCDTGTSRCSGNKRQECVDNVWKSTMCPKTSECVRHDDVVQCWMKPPTPPTVPEPCTPGDRKCDSDAYALMICGDNEMWHTEKKCTTYGDCITDSPGQAHCETGGVGPSNVQRQTNSTECAYGDWACDTHQRFMYKCAKNGTWSVPYQCSRAGGCQPEGPTDAFPKGRMTCAGFPNCEYMMYLYPTAGSPDAETKEKYRKSMCADEAVSGLSS